MGYLLFKGAPALISILLVSPAAQAGKVEDAVEYRQGVMNILSWNAGHMVAMA